MLVNLEQGYSDVPDHTRKFNDSHSFWKSEISELFGTYLYMLGLRFGPLRADLMSAYSLGKLNLLSELLLHAARSNLCWITTTSRVDSQRHLYRWVIKPLVLVKAIGKDKNTRRVDALITLISPIDLMLVLLVVRAMDMVIPH